MGRSEVPGLVCDITIVWKIVKFAFIYIQCH